MPRAIVTTGTASEEWLAQAWSALQRQRSCLLRMSLEQCLCDPVQGAVLRGYAAHLRATSRGPAIDRKRAAAGDLDD